MHICVFRLCLGGRRRNYIERVDFHIPNEMRWGDILPYFLMWVGRDVFYFALRNPHPFEMNNIIICVRGEAIIYVSEGAGWVRGWSGNWTDYSRIWKYSLFPLHTHTPLPPIPNGKHDMGGEMYINMGGAWCRWGEPAISLFSHLRLELIFPRIIQYVYSYCSHFVSFF